MTPDEETTLPNSFANRVSMLDEFLELDESLIRAYLEKMPPNSLNCLACAIHVFLISRDISFSSHHVASTNMLLEPFAEYWKPQSELGIIEKRWATETWALGRTWLSIFEEARLRIEPTCLLNLSRVIESFTKH